MASVLFAAGMVYLELRYPVWSHIYFAREGRCGDGVGGEKDGEGLV